MSKMLKVVGASWLQTKISSYILGILGIMAILALFAGHFERSQEDGNYAATIFYSEKTGYRIEYWGQSNKPTDIPKGAARAYFRKDIDTTGWSLLEVETDGSYPDEIQAYAAGIVEGALTWHLIHTHLQNTIRAKCDNQPVEKQCDKIRDTLEKSVNIWKTRADDKSSDDPLWHQVSLHYRQINGIFTGWEHGVARSKNKFDTDISDLYWLNSMAEISEIQRKLNITLEDNNFDELPGLSSAFLRVVNETLEDGTTSERLFLAQNAAGNYTSMTRILKRYKFNYHQTSNDSSLVPGTSVDFAGYPGSVTSQDEFYIVRGKNHHKLAVTGTTLKNYNNNLWKNVNITEEVPIGPRITAANHLATNVSSWGHILASSNSGTASKQWLVVDFNRLGRLHSHTPKKARKNTKRSERATEVTLSKRTKHTVVHRSSSGRPSGLVWLIEQVPSRTHSADLTETLLEQGYLATFGLPFFSDIADVTKIPQMETKYGDIFSNTRSPRANTFKVHYKNATTVDSILRVMRRNNMTNKNSTISCTNENQTVCERHYYTVLGVRGDIVSDHNRAYGVIDTKIVTGRTNYDTLDFIAISSPPFTETSQKNSTKTQINKGNVATYTDQFDDELNFNGLKIRDLVKHQQEEAEQESKELHDKEIIKPFQWSESDFKDILHEGLPDIWEFGPYKPEWFW